MGFEHWTSSLDAKRAYEYGALFEDDLQRLARNAEVRLDGSHTRRSLSDSTGRGQINLLFAVVRELVELKPYYLLRSRRRQRDRRSIRTTNEYSIKDDLLLVTGNGFQLLAAAVATSDMSCCSTEGSGSLTRSGALSSI